MQICDQDGQRATAFRQWLHFQGSATAAPNPQSQSDAGASSSRLFTVVTNVVDGVVVWSHRCCSPRPCLHLDALDELRFWARWVRRQSSRLVVFWFIGLFALADKKEIDEAQVRGRPRLDRSVEYRAVGTDHDPGKAYRLSAECLLGHGLASHNCRKFATFSGLTHCPYFISGYFWNPSPHRTCVAARGSIVYRSRVPQWTCSPR